MVHLDWSAEGSEGEFQEMPPGVYRVRVGKVDLRHGKASGDAYLSACLHDADTGRILGWDVIMLEGPGWPGIGKRKLSILLAGDMPAELVPEHVEGKQAYAVLKEEFYKDKRKLSVDIAAQGYTAGYRPLDDPPPEVTEQADVPHDSDEVPF